MSFSCEKGYFEAMIEDNFIIVVFYRIWFAWSPKVQKSLFCLNVTICYNPTYYRCLCDS